MKPLPLLQPPGRVGGARRAVLPATSPQPSWGLPAAAGEQSCLLLRRPRGEGISTQTFFHDRISSGFFFPPLSFMGSKPGPVGRQRGRSV